MADMRKWEDLSPAERSARLKKYDSEVSAQAKSRLADQAAATKPKKAKGDMLVNIYSLVKSRGKVINKRVDDASQ